LELRRLVLTISLSRLAFNAAPPLVPVTLQKFAAAPMQVAPTMFLFLTTHFAMIPTSATASASAPQETANQARRRTATMETHVQQPAAILSQAATTPHWRTALHVPTGAIAPPTIRANLVFVVARHVTAERLHKAVWLPRAMMQRLAANWRQTLLAQNARTIQSSLT